MLQSVLQCVAECVAECVSVCSRVLQSVLQCVASCCRVWQSVLQCGNTGNTVRATLRKKTLDNVLAIAGYTLFYRALLQKIPIILRSLLTKTL